MLCTTKNSNIFVLCGLNYAAGDGFNAKQEQVCDFPLSTDLWRQSCIVNIALQVLFSDQMHLERVSEL